MVDLQLVPDDIEDRRERYRLFLGQVFAAVDTAEFDARRAAARQAARLKERDAADVEQAYLRQHALALTALLLERPQSAPASTPAPVDAEHEHATAALAEAVRRIEASVAGLQDQLARLQADVERLQEQARVQAGAVEKALEKAAADAAGAAGLAQRLGSATDELKAQLARAGERVQRLEQAQAGASKQPAPNEAPKSVERAEPPVVPPRIEESKKPVKSPPRFIR